MSTAIAERDQRQSVANRNKSIKDMLIERQVEIGRMLPTHINVERFMKSALLVISRSEKLQQCTPQSVIASVINAAELGLDFTPAKGEAYLVPFWNSKTRCMEAQFMPGYRGFITLARRSGVIKNIEAHLVYSHDEFNIEYGATPKLYHKPEVFKSRGSVIGGYAIAFFDDGSFQATFMSAEELESMKGRTKSRDKSNNIVGPWITDENEMKKKTTVRRLFKMLPCSVDLEKAIEYDNRATRIVDDENAIEPGGASRTDSLAETLASTPDNMSGDEVDAEYEDVADDTPPTEPKTKQDYVAAVKALGGQRGLDDNVLNGLAGVFFSETVKDWTKLVQDRLKSLHETLTDNDMFRNLWNDYAASKDDGTLAL